MATPVPHDDPGAVHAKDVDGTPACDESLKDGGVTHVRDDLTCAMCITLDDPNYTRASLPDRVKLR